MSEKPVMHGRDHRPGGEDPIPGLGGASWIFGYDSAISVPSRSTPTTHYDFTASAWYTNNSSVFGVDAVSSTGVTINGAGFYVAMIECEFAVASGAVTTAAEMTWNISGVNNEVHDATAFLPDFMAGWAITKAIQGFALDPSGPTSGADLILRQTSGVTASVSMQFAVVQLTTDYGNF